MSVAAEEAGADAANRGRPASVAHDGTVKGSGASAGGGGAPEDIDADPAGGGGGNAQPRAPAPPETGADVPSHGSR